MMKCYIKHETKSTTQQFPKIPLTVPLSLSSDTTNCHNLLDEGRTSSLKDRKTTPENTIGKWAFEKFAIEALVEL